MVKHTQTIRRQQPTNILSVFNYFVGLALKGLSTFSNFLTILEFSVTSVYTTVWDFSGHITLSSNKIGRRRISKILDFHDSRFLLVMSFYHFCSFTCWQIETWRSMNKIEQKLQVCGILSIFVSVFFFY